VGDGRSGRTGGVAGGRAEWREDGRSGGGRAELPGRPGRGQVPVNLRVWWWVGGGKIRQGVGERD
jgi:hypothetical protein